MSINSTGNHDAVNDENYNTSNMRLTSSINDIEVSIRSKDKLSPIIQFKSASDRRKLLLGCLYIRTHKAKMRYDKMMNMDMRATIDSEVKDI